MTLIEITLLGLALSMDAFAVTISDLMAYPKLSRARCLALPITFGVFQGLMVLVGYLLGSFAFDYIDAYAGPIALVILGIIGAKMIYEALKDMRANKGRREREESHTVASLARASNNNLTASVGEHREAKPAKTPEEALAKTLSLPTILIQGVATSIDALIVGVSLIALEVNIILATPIVALTTFMMCLAGLAIGRRFGVLLGERAQIIGGIVLILIGIKACFF